MPTVVNVLPMETRESIVSALIEGNSVRVVERMTDVPKSTILRLALAMGDGCERLHNRLMQGLRSVTAETSALKSPPPQLEPRWQRPLQRISSPV